MLIWRGTISHWKDKMIEITKIISKVARPFKMEISPKHSQRYLRSPKLLIGVSFKLFVSPNSYLSPIVGLLLY